MSIINIEKFDFKKEPLFFGKGLGLQRYDIFRYKKLDDLFEQQLGFFWKPQEVNISEDKGQFSQLSEGEKSVFTKNLKYQILLDSVQSRGIPNLLENCSNLEFEACAKAWELFETIHSKAYTHIIRRIYPNPSEVFDSITEDEEIIKRSISVTKHYDELIDSIGGSLDEQKKKLYLTLVSINILEGIRFYVSFACAFAFAEMGKMEGNAKIISLIMRDEALHLAVTQNLLNYLRKNKDEGFQHIVEECEEIVIQMYRDAAAEEMDWAKYLFEGGGMLGLNAEILIKFMEWLTDKRMKGIGLQPIFGTTKNPINWMNKWMKSKSVQIAPQETELESYKISSIEQNINEVNFDQFKF